MTSKVFFIVVDNNAVISCSSDITETRLLYHRGLVRFIPDYQI